jgi:hypothetical protein
MWYQCQLALDDHLQACPHCDSLELGPYCTRCGVRLVPEAYVCDVCHTSGLGAYCAQCGGVLVSAVAEAIADDRFDWDAWARSLEPFLGGITPQEQALLAQG